MVDSIIEPCIGLVQSGWGDVIRERNDPLLRAAGQVDRRTAAR
jgi:hypothetical protein